MILLISVLGCVIVNLFTKISISLSSLTSVLNTIAFIFVQRTKPRKSFDILLMKIVFINVTYSLNELSTSLAHAFTPSGMIFRNFKLYFWLNIKSYMIIVTLCNFIVLVAVQRVIKTAFPLKSKLYVGKKNNKEDMFDNIRIFISSICNFDNTKFHKQYKF